MGKPFFVDDCMRRAVYGNKNTPELPFSFSHNGVHSSEMDLSWNLESLIEKEDVKEYTLSSKIPATDLIVRAEVKIYETECAADWTLHFTNTGTAESGILSEIRALDFAHPLPEDDLGAILHFLRGSACGVDDWEPYDRPLHVIGENNQTVLPDTPSEIAFTSKGGKPSNGTSPFFNAEWPGGGMICAVGWSGQWNGRASVGKARGFTLDIGMEDCHFFLYPGETVRSPRILVLHWSEKEEDSYNAFRRLMFRHILHKVNGEVPSLPIAHLTTSFDMPDPNDSDAADVLAHMEAVKDCGFEVLWLDAFYHEGGFPKGMGNMGFPIDRTVDKVQFPDGIRPLSDRAHALGSEFMLWVEPERVSEGTLLTTEHPEWIIDAGIDRDDPPFNKNYMFNLGDPEACDFMIRCLSEYIEQYRIDILRFDFNYFPLPYWRSHDEKNGGERRRGISEIRYTEGLYRMWDALLTGFPHLRIDNCASGGMRIDLETSARSFPNWRTDATIFPVNVGDFDQAAIQNQLMTLGLSRYIPYTASGMMGSEPYHFRSGFNSGIPFCEDCRNPDYPKDQLIAAIREGKRIRPYFAGDFYVLTPFSGTSHDNWCAMQYHLPREEKGLVLVFRREMSPYREMEAALRGIDPDACYDVCFCEGYVKADPVKMDGRALGNLVIRVDRPQSSLVIEYEKK